MYTYLRSGIIFLLFYFLPHVTVCFFFFFQASQMWDIFLLSEMISHLSKFIFRCVLFHQFFFICLQRSVVCHSVKFGLKCNPPPSKPSAFILLWTCSKLCVLLISVVMSFQNMPFTFCFVIV